MEDALKVLQEYADWLDDRKLLWPAAPQPVLPRAIPYLKRLRGIRAVTWDVYGTLLAISEGRLMSLAPDPLRMDKVALDKTIHEFNMWNSMSRKPGPPWEYMFQQYKRLVEAAQLAASPPRGSSRDRLGPHLEGADRRLGKKEFTWDEGLFGDIDEFSEKVAWFFHAALQGAAAAPNALKALKHMHTRRIQAGPRRRRAVPSRSCNWGGPCTAKGGPPREALQHGLRVPVVSVRRQATGGHALRGVPDAAGPAQSRPNRCCTSPRD